MKMNERIEKLKFWWARKTIKDGKTFDLSMDDVGMRVRILRGKFRGVEYRYSPLRVISDDGLVDFSTYVEYTPKNVDVSDPKFAQLTTTILRILLEEAIPETASQAQKVIEQQVIDEDRNTDTGELIEERNIHEESSALLEKRVSRRKPRKKAISANTESHTEIQQPAVKKRGKARSTGKKRPHGK